MTRNSWIILCLAYIVGLLSTNLFTIASSGLTPQQLFWLTTGLIGLSAIAFLGEIFLIDKKTGKIPTLRQIPKKFSQQWLGAGIVAILAVIYFQLRIPQPHTNDISYQVTAANTRFVTVAGQVITEPRLNSSQRLKFFLKVIKVDQEKVSGKLYATLPLLQGTGIYPGQNISLKGVLYLPQAAQNSSSFDFKSYLADQGVFAGMQGSEVIFDRKAEPRWGWWKIRQRIVRSQLRGLGSPTGQLVSSVVLGHNAVDLPDDLRDRFIEAGLAHVLAASGFQVSLLLGIMLNLTASLAPKTRLAIGVGTLLIYLGLTGIQASVFRACLMGVVLLLAMTMDTKVKPLGSLLFAATIILLFNPVFIRDLGFQLSFLATLGLIVTMPVLQAKLDWLPSAISTVIAVPLAASIWVLPLLSYQFHSVATYSIVVNILCTPLITIISLGGMASAIAGLIVPILGSAIAWLLILPTLWLIAIANFFTSLPGSSWAIGQISMVVLLTLYGLFLLVWLNQWWRSHLRLISVFVMMLIIFPVGYRNFNLTQVSILRVQPEPIVLIQDQGKVILINSGNAKIANYNVLPFLAKEGINRIDYAIDLNQKPTADWLKISDRLAIENFVLSSSSELLFTPANKETLVQNFDQAISTKSLKIAINSRPSILQLETATENWLVLGNTKLGNEQIQQYMQNNPSPKPIALIGARIEPGWLEVKPQTIISSEISAEKPQEINRRDTYQPQFYNPEQDGVIYWTPDEGIKPLAIPSNNFD